MLLRVLPVLALVGGLSVPRSKSISRRFQNRHVVKALIDDDDDTWSLSKYQKQSKKPRFEIPGGVGISTKGWLDETQGYKKKYTDKDLKAAFDVCIEGGVTFFDAYPESEELLGSFTAESYGRPMVASRYAPGLLPARAGAIATTVAASVENLGVTGVDLLQLGSSALPGPLGRPNRLYDGAAAAKQRGLCGAVGVVGFDAKRLERAHAALAKLGITLVSNQVPFSLLNQKALEDGTIDACKRLGVVVLAAAPLAGGLCGGRYTATNPTGGRVVKNRKTVRGSRQVLGKFSYDDLRKVLPLHNALASVARTVGIREGDAKGVTSAMAALGWVVAKGAVPLVGVKTEADAAEVAAMSGAPWRLKAAEVEALDAAAEKTKTEKVEKQRITNYKY